MADPELQRAYEDAQLLATVRRRLVTCADQVHRQERVLRDLEASYAKERADVDVLNRTSLRRVLAKLAGNHDEKLAREEAEAAAVKIRLDGQRVRVEQTRADHAALRQQAKGLADADDRLKAAVATETKRLIDSGTPMGDQMLALRQRIAENAAAQREHLEAREAGRAAIHAVNQVTVLLGKALGWSTGDLFNLPFADWAEHSRLDDAAELCWHAQRYIDRFAREMADVDLKVNVRMPDVDTSRFADYFFDNVITDSIRHNKIKRTAEHVSRIQSYLSARLSEVDQRLAGIRSAAHALDAERRRLLGLSSAG